MNTEIVALVGLITSLMGIVFTWLTYKKKEKEEHKKEGKNEGLIISDIGYIKACVDRVEKNLASVDERYRNIIERIAKVEESVANVTKRVDEMYKLEVS